VQTKDTTVNIWTINSTLYNEPINTQSTDNVAYCPLLYCSYRFGHYCVILREFVVSTLLSYTSISNGVVGNTI